MLRTFYLFLLVLTQTPFVAASPQPQPSIDWAKNDAPPFYINANGDARGFADGVQEQLQQVLPQFSHRTVHMPLPRLNDFWQKGENYCFASMIYKPASNSSNFILSRPNVYYAPHGVITRKDFAPTANKTQVLLSSLLTQPQLVLGMIGNRAFGTTVDNLLAQHQQTTERFVRRDRDGVRSLLNMLKLDRIDYFLDYAFVFQYYNQQQEFAGNLRFVALEETDEEGILGAIGCTNNPWGRAMIAHINQGLETLLRTPRYREYVSRWQAVGMTEEQYWQAFDTAVQAARTEEAKAQ